MNLSKREFFQVLAAASAAGMGLARHADADAATAQQGLYDLKPFGNVSFLHMTDCHAQLKPMHFREPSVNLGVGAMQGQLPHLVGAALLKAAGVPAGSAAAHAFTYIDFERASRRYGKVGGFAHLATLVHSDVAEPCHVSPPSSSSAPGRLALSCLTSVAKWAKPPTLP